jgi:hypothetical protein
MVHAQKPDFILRRNGRVHLNRRGRQFSRLLAAELCASAVVMLDTQCYEVVWRVLATHSIRQFPFHFPCRASPNAITFQLESTYTFRIFSNASHLRARSPNYQDAILRNVYTGSTTHLALVSNWCQRLFTPEVGGGGEVDRIEQGVKLPNHNHLVQKLWSYTSTSPYVITWWATVPLYAILYGHFTFIWNYIKNSRRISRKPNAIYWPLCNKAGSQRPVCISKFENQTVWYFVGFLKYLDNTLY